MDLLHRADHRAWPPPQRPWLMTQTWHDVLFAHWPVPREVLEPKLPQGLTLDTFEGQAWLGVLPFHMSGIRLRNILPVPGSARFPEINVRTYVVRDGKPGVWFFSLDAGSLPAVWGGRTLFHLPYFHARFAVRRSGDRVAYESRRNTPGGPSPAFRVRYRPTGPVRLAPPGTLEHWLTERYCLYAQDRRGRLYRGEIHHLPWPLQPAEAEIAENGMAAAHGITLPEREPLLHYTARLKVLIWPLVRA